MEQAGEPWASPRLRFSTIAMLFVLFDAEAVLLFAVASALRGNPLAALEVGVFVIFLGFGLAVRVAQGGTRMALVDRIGAGLENLGGGIILTSVDALVDWSRGQSLWAFPMGTACCAMELIAASFNKFDFDRLGTFPRPDPRHTDVMILAGTITEKMKPAVRRLYDQMPDPKWVIAMGNCTVSGGIFYYDSLLRGARRGHLPAGRRLHRGVSASAGVAPRRRPAAARAGQDRVDRAGQAPGAHAEPAAGAARERRCEFDADGPGESDMTDFERLQARLAELSPKLYPLFSEEFGDTVIGVRRC